MPQTEEELLKEKIIRTQEQLAHAQWEAEKAAQIQKLKQGDDGPPKLHGVRRSKLSRYDKQKIIHTYGIEIYNSLPI